ncbi:uncharacterized protein LOC141608313 [Silene latifolia]|uniref:uncharacterized protein LOC141608313 n=1 Tax=Silene latifolia TaxID=37657 RepID=UPI003D76FB77
MLQDLSIPQLDGFQQDFLSQPFSASDVENAFFSMKPNKSPGPDGFPPRFYHLFWGLIKDDITSAVLSFLNSGILPPAWNNTHVVLIPKVDLPEMISQFRPISLCNVIYRAASKCIALRLKKVIDGIIGQNQNAFVPGRLINDWGFLGHEILTYINQRRRGTRCYGAIKLDMNKAFDRVSWPFLFKVLKLFGFPKAFRKLIKTCVRTVSLQILINGTPSSRIFPQCGLRQGDPISPYLFILCMEILSLLILKAEANGEIEGIKLSRQSPAISHLLYADDSLLCLRLTTSACESLRRILNDFSSISGQMINHQKSYIKFSPNTPTDFKEHILDILHVQSKSNFGLYLGIPIDLGRRKLPSFQFLLDKLSNKILSWGPANFSQAAKLILINSILMASIAYVASVIPLPQQITSKINYLVDIFWWKKPHHTNAQHWLPFEQLQQPKSNGGLGLKNATIVSQARLAKNFWRSHHMPSLLFSKVMRSKYKKDFPIPRNKSQYSAASYAWKGVVKTSFLLRDGIAWKFGNGKSIDLKSDAWILGNKPSFKAQRQPQSVTFDDLLLDSTHWNTKVIFQLFNKISAKAICTLELPHQPMDDYIYWKSTEDGRYSSRSGYSFLLEKCSLPFSSGSRLCSDFQWDLLWKIPCQPHIKIFLWKMAHQILPTSDVLIRRGLVINPACCFCHLNSESMGHLFRDCEVTKRVWFASHLGLRTDSASNVPFHRWFQNFLRYLTRTDAEATGGKMHFILLFFAIWNHRNNVLFRALPVNPAAIIHEADQLLAQQLVFCSRLPETVLAPSKQSVFGPSFSGLQQPYHCVDIVFAFNKKMSTCSFQICYNDLVLLDCCDRFCNSRLQATIIALLEAMTYASYIQSVLFRISNKNLLQLLYKSDMPLVPIAVSNSFNRVKLFLDCNQNWYVSGFL